MKGTLKVKPKVRKIGDMLNQKANQWGTTSRRVPQLEREMDQMRKVIAEMRENMRRMNPVEDLVH